MIENIAVYIDADNSSYKHFLMIYEEIKKYGNIIIGKIYGDWTILNKKWKNISIDYSFQPMNCFNIPKKNSTDIYLICDLINDLYKNNNIDIFVIVSSDSDFTEASRHIRSNGKKVYVIGKKDTHTMLKNSCNKFIENEILEENKKLLLISNIFKQNKKISFEKFKYEIQKINKIYNINHAFFQEFINKNVKVINNNAYYMKDILDTINILFETSNNGLINLCIVKDTLKKKDSTFDQTNYGFNSMKKFILNFFSKELDIIMKKSNAYIKKKL